LKCGWTGSEVTSRFVASARGDPVLVTPEPNCPVCRSNRGVERISPGSVIHEGDHWLVEHAYPSSLLGWLVIVLKRHAEALHELTEEEARELGVLQRRVALAFRDETGSAKEYSVCYGEAPRFAHLHAHLVPRAPDLPEELRGSGIFTHLQGSEEPVPAEAVVEFCERMEGVV